MAKRDRRGHGGTQCDCRSLNDIGVSRVISIRSGIPSLSVIQRPSIDWTAEMIKIIMLKMSLYLYGLPVSVAHWLYYIVGIETWEESREEVTRYWDEVRKL